MLLRQSLNVPTETHVLLTELCPQVTEKNDQIFFVVVPSRSADLTKRLLQSSWKFFTLVSSRLRRKYCQSLYVFQAIQICVFLFTLVPAASVLPFTPALQKKALYPSIIVVLFSLGGFMDSFEVEGDRECQHLSEQAKIICRRDDSCTTPLQLWTKGLQGGRRTGHHQDYLIMSVRLAAVLAT